ncbi:hypothetical protein M758_UG188900, partial [Ceratodon purpureus]
MRESFTMYPPYPGLDLPILKAAPSLPTLAHKEISPELPVRAAEHSSGVPGRPKIACMRHCSSKIRGLQARCCCAPANKFVASGSSRPPASVQFPIHLFLGKLSCQSFLINKSDSLSSLGSASISYST